MVALHLIEPATLGVPVVAAMVTDAIENISQPIEAHDHTDNGCAKEDGQKREHRDHDDRGQVPRHTDEIVWVAMVQGMADAQEGRPRVVDVAVQEILGQGPGQQTDKGEQDKLRTAQEKLAITPRVAYQPSDEADVGDIAKPVIEGGRTQTANGFQPLAIGMNCRVHAGKRAGIYFGNAFCKFLDCRNAAKVSAQTNFG